MSDDDTQANDDETKVPLLCFSRSGVPVNLSELLSRSQESSGVVFAPSGGGLRLRHLGNGDGPMVYAALIGKINTGEITDPAQIPFEYRASLMNLLRKEVLASEFECLHDMGIFK